MNLQQALQILAVSGQEQDQAYAVLADSDGSGLIQVSLVHVNSVLSRFVAGDIDQDALEDWAMLLDARDEFDCNAVEDYIYALNNSELMGGLSQSTVSTMAELLKQQLNS